MSGMLFDTSPDETEQSGKKKARPRKVTAPRPSPIEDHATPVIRPSEARFLASLDVPCPYCGIEATDLVEERWSDKERKWLVQCGWQCLASWLIDPIPGILDKEDAKQTESGKAFVVKGGRFDGKTFDEIAAAGHRNHIVGLAEKGREYLAAAAKEWLSQNGG